MYYLYYFYLEILLAFYITKKIKEHKDDENKRGKVYSIVLKISAIFIAFYFLIQSGLFYESLQNLFSYILFDNLSWKLFSLFLLGCVFYLASFDFENIGRVCEVFFYVIIGSLIFLTILGALHTDFQVVLPMQTIANHNLLNSMQKFNVWFGDFFVVLFLGSRARNIKLKTTLLTYILSMIFVIILVIEFNGIFFDLSVAQPSLLSTISEQSLLGIDIGRIDWFFILVVEIGTGICASLCLCMSKYSLSYAFKKVNPNFFLFIMMAYTYFVDILYLVDLNAKEKFFLNFASNYSIAIKLGVIILLFIKMISLRKNKSIKIQGKVGV